MKKAMALFLCIIVFLPLNACDYNAPLRNKMLDYYSRAENYVQVQGIIKTIAYLEDINELRVEIEITTEDHQFPYIGEDGCGEFAIVSWSSYEFNLEVDNVIAFTSAPMYFYNGHVWPIVAIQSKGEEYLSFCDGKDNYLNWIQKTFN